MQCIIAVSLQLIRPAIFNTNLFGEKMLFYTYQQNIFFMCSFFFFYYIFSHRTQFSSRCRLHLQLAVQLHNSKKDDIDSVFFK